ncbi:MAG: ester cyclase [Chitinophagaceae bacterium]|nr:ester cyclase [Chitinophagaceae bacterium]
MTKILYVIFCGLLFFFISCNDAATVEAESKDPRAQKNLEASHTVNKAFETGDVTGLDSVIADDFVDHTDRGDIKGRDSLKAMVTMVHRTNKDMKMDILKELADDEYVFSWMRFTGTSDGSMMPAGPYDMRAIQVAKFNNGKITEHWEFMEPREMMKMMSQMEGAGKSKDGGNKSDSAKKAGN